MGRIARDRVSSAPRANGRSSPALVQTDKPAESIQKAARGAVDLIGSRKPTDAEIRFAKDNLVLALPGNNETSGEVARSYADILGYGLPDTLQRGERSRSKLGRCQHSRGDAAAGTPGTYVVDQRGRIAGVCADLSTSGQAFPGSSAACWNVSGG
jgi:hypothetical protein